MDCGIEGADDEDEQLSKLDNYLCELKELQIRDGLHIFGKSPVDRQLIDLLVALVRIPRGDGKEGDASLIRALANDLELDIMGSGDMSVTGSCDTLDLDIMGSGNLEAKNVKCDNAKVAIMGSGDAEIHASKSLTATIMGSGDITVYGNPAKIKSRVAGSGDIREK